MRERVTSRKNALIVKLKSLGSRPSHRREEGAFLLDGPTLLEEALDYGGLIEMVAVAEGFDLPPLPDRVRVVEVPADVLASVAPTKTSQGVLAVCKLPDVSLPQRLDGCRYMILDSVQDPGNVGAILRSCSAFGADGLILSGDCADPFGPKAVRASMGAIFRTPIYAGDEDSIRAALGDLPLYRADLTADAMPITETKIHRAALVTGSEGQGVSPFWRACSQAVTIPMQATSESLNAAVAASIFLWEMWKNREGE